MTKVESLYVPEKKLIKQQPHNKADLKTILRSSEIKLLEQITTIKKSSQHSNQLAHKVSPLLSQQTAAVLNPLKKESNRNDQESKMGQDCGSCIAKYILCLFNFIFFVSNLLFFHLHFYHVCQQVFYNEFLFFFLRFLDLLYLHLVYGCWLIKIQSYHF